MHGEPIVCTPDDAMRSFQAGNLDYLAIGNWLVKHPSLLEEEQLTAAAVQV
jgi:carbamoyltransferase